jgi:hypothetical protein
MITERDDQPERNDDRATLVWSLLVSGFANLMAWVVLAWVLDFRTHDRAVAQAQPLETFVVTSSSLNIAKRTQPVPPQPNQQVQTQPQEHQQQAPKPEQPAKAATPKPQAQPTELAHITPHGTPQPHSAPKKQSRGTLAEQLAQQEVAFQHEAQQINAQHSVLSVATIDPNQRPSSQQPFQMDMPGMPGQPRRGEGIIYPTPMARVRGYDCYGSGSTYTLRYMDGQLEQGEIPWPFCYPPRQDPFLQRYRSFDMPLPLPGYRLPSGVQLQPAARDVYQAWLGQQS